MTPRPGTTAFVLWPLLLAAACLSPVLAAQRSVTDDFDREVVLETAATRIVSLAPHNTENIYSAGAGDRIVGVVDHSDYPPAAEKLPSMGTHVQFNLEAILALNPDLVVAWRGGNNAEALARIEDFGIPVYYSEPRTFAAIVDNIRDIAVLAGTKDRVDPTLAAIEARINTLRSSHASSRPLDVFYQVWTDPLMTLNGDHFISRVLEVCGARNLFASLPIIAPRVSMEAVIDANPDVIVTGTVDNQKPEMSMWLKWQSIKAVANDHFIFVDSDVMHRHTLRMLNGIEQLCIELDTVRASLSE